MFPDTKMEVPSAIVASLKISRAFELKSGFVGSCQVSRATDQPRYILRHDVENFARTFTRCCAFCVRWKCRQVFIPSIRQLVALHAIELIREIRIFFAVFVQSPCPLLMQFRATSSDSLTKVLTNSSRHQELGIFRPAVELLGQPNLVFTQRFTVSCTGV